MTEEKNIEEKGKLLVQWEFPEFNKYQISKTWYFIMGIIIIALITFCIFTQNYLFLLIIIIFITIFFLRVKREPHIVNLQIFEDGIQIGENTFYEWKDINKFWIIFEPPEIKNLYLDFKMGIRPSINISLQNQNPVEIRNLLLQYIQEDLEKENESFSDGLSKLMKL